MVDNILVLSNGKINEQGSYQDLLTRNGPFARFMREYLFTATAANDGENASEGEDNEGRSLQKQHINCVFKHKFVYYL